MKKQIKLKNKDLIMLGFITGNNRGVSTIPLFVFSFPILPSKSLCLISKLIYQSYQTASKLIKKCWAIFLSIILLL